MKSIEEMKAMDQAAAQYVPEKAERLKEEDMQWFRGAKFGMFLHWGLYSMLGQGEWVLFNQRLSVKEYEALAKDFSVPEYDPRAWARTAKAAGMKYMVLTTRHHDGFCLFDSKASSFNAKNSAAGRDLVREYVNACREEGLKVGFYYSPMDWRFPGYFFPELYWDNAQEMKRQCWAQLEELMTQYGKIDLLWFDGEWLALGGLSFGGNGWGRSPYWATSKYMRVNYFWESEKLINQIRKWQPGIMINNRGGWEGDFHVRERRIDGIRTDKPWDSNDCNADSWGYVPGRPVLPLRQLVKNLTDIVVRDGNYLLNIGPTGDGSMEPAQTARLEQLGQWLERFGESIYNTRGGPILPGRWGGATYRGNQVYLHITEWEQDELGLPTPGRLTGARGLTTQDFSVTEADGRLHVQVPIPSRDPLDTILCLEFDQPIQWGGVAGQENDVYCLADGL